MLAWLTTFFGPIFAKEMIELSRRPRYYSIRVIYGVALLMFLWMAFPTANVTWREEMSIKTMAAGAQSAFQTVMAMQFIVVVFAVPAFVGGVVATERLGGTLDLLKTTALTTREILFGKLGSRIAVAFLLMLIPIPILFILGFWGGVDYSSLLLCELGSVLAILLVGSLSIFFSTSCRSPTGAMIRTYTWVVLLFIGRPMIQLWLLLRLQTLPSRYRYLFGELVSGETASLHNLTVDGFYSMLTIETFVNPIVLIYAGLIPEFRMTLEELMGLRFILFAIIGSISLSCLLFVAACRRLSAGEGYAGFRVKVYVRLTKILQKFKTVPSDDKNESVFGYSSNPLVARGRTWPYDREKYLRRLQWGGFFLTMVPLALGYWNEPERFLSSSREVNAFVWLGAACLVAIVGASSVVSDRRNGFFEMVLQTSLDPRQIIDGTVWTVFRHLRIGFVTSWIVGAIYLFDPDRRFLYLVPCILITGTLFAIVVMYFSVSCSLIAREFSTPVSLSVLFTLGFLFVIAAPFLSTTHPQSNFDVFAVIVIVLGLWYGLRKMSVAAVGGLFIAVYLGFAWLGNSWNYSVQPLFPMSAMFPLYWLSDLIRPDEQFGLNNYVGLGQWWQSLGCYWLSMIATIVWSRWWLIRNFDRLAGRTLDKPDGWPKSVLAGERSNSSQLKDRLPMAPGSG